MPTRPDRYIQLASQYEPEGVFLACPIKTSEVVVLQGWGDNPAYHGQFTYNGVRLKGHPGVDLATPPDSSIVAVDQGRVSEISRDPAGLGRYVKIEHRWGESLYAQLGAIVVESGQSVKAGQVIAHAETISRNFPLHLHFAIRIYPYNRFDGWGGFSDPTPFLYVVELKRFEENDELKSEEETPQKIPTMLMEKTGMRRP